MLRAIVLISCLGIALGLLSCSGDQSTPTPGSGGYGYDGGSDGSTSSGGGGASCGFAPSGDGAVVVSAQGGASVLDDAQGAAMSQTDDWFRALPARNTGVIARGPCGAVGVLLRPSEGSLATLQYVDVSVGELVPETIESTSSAFDAALFFDEACSAIVLRGTASAGYVQYTRSGPNQWELDTIAPDLGAVLGETPTSLTHHWGGLGSDGALHAIARVTMPSGSKLLHASRSTAPGSSWSFETVPAPPATDLDLVRVDPSGALHALFTITEYPCDPCNLDLVHGLLAPGSDAWTTDVVQPSKWGPPQDEFAVDPSLAFDAGGAPWIVARFEVRTVTGSLVSSQLRLYGKEAGGWCHETAISAPDGYEGGDGPLFTGAHPDLQIDDTGRFHVLFSDEAQWHDAQGYANNVAGQLRYAVRAGAQWYHATLYAQAGQSESPQPLIGLDGAFLVTSPDGTEAIALGTERVWETNSIYNDHAVPLALRALVTHAAVAPQ